MKGYCNSFSECTLDVLCDAEIPHDAVSLFSLQVLVAVCLLVIVTVLTLFVVINLHLFVQSLKYYY